MSSELTSRFSVSLPLPVVMGLLIPDRYPLAEMSDEPELTVRPERSILLLVNRPLSPEILLSRG